MAEKDKFADELMSDEELDQVAGGTNGEYDALRNAIGKVEVYRNLLATRVQEKTVGLVGVDYMKKYLKQHYEIDAEISLGFFGGSANVYKRNGESLSHQQVLDMIKNNNPGFLDLGIYE